MRPGDRGLIPAETVAVVRVACPKGTRVTRVRDVLGPVFEDEQFEGWFAAEGRAAIAPGLVALACVLQSMENLTDRDAANAVRIRMDWKYALGLELTDPGFDFSVFSEFRDRLGVDERAMVLLQTMLTRAGEAGLLRARGRVRTDSTHVLARIRTVNRLEKVGETVRLALEEIARVASGWLGVRITVAIEERYCRRIESARLPEAAKARTAWGEQTATDGAWLLGEITADPDAAWLLNLPKVNTLQDIWDQECVVDEAGAWHLRSVRITEGAAHIGAASDPEARWSRKRHTEWTGYKVHLSETCDEGTPNLIVAVHTTVATTADVAVLDDIHDILDAQGIGVGEHYVDEGYATAEAVDKADQNGMELIGPLALDRSWQAKEGLGYDRSSFQIDWDHRQARCPEGKTSYSWTTREHIGGQGATIRFHQRDCRSCPMRAHCTTSEYAGRQIVIGSQTLDTIQRRNRADRNDPDWQHRYNRRAGIEGTISQAVRGFDIRDCQYIGLRKTRVQHVLTACAMNAARIADWHDRDRTPAPERPTSRLPGLRTRFREQPTTPS